MTIAFCFFLRRLLVSSVWARQGSEERDGEASAQVMHSPLVTGGHSECSNLEEQKQALDKGLFLILWCMTVCVGFYCPLFAEHSTHMNMESRVIYMYIPAALPKFEATPT